jgi:hypothetical protein
MADLALLVGRWPTLQQTTRDAIIALVTADQSKNSQ